MQPRVTFIPPENGGDIVDLCSEALVSKSPPLFAGAIREIAAVRERLVNELASPIGYDADATLALLENLSPYEGMKLHDFLCRISDTDFSKATIVEALTVDEDGTKGQKDNRVNEWGYLSASATINGEALPDSLHIDCKKAGRDAIEIVPRVLIFLSEVSDVEARRCITQACLRTLELRLHFDFRRT